MAATRTGDDLAFERLYKRYQRRIAAYIHGMVHDHGRAEDITQDVFMSALRRMRETDRPIIFKPWIYEIAKNACIDAFRRSKRAEEVSYDADESLGGSDYGRLVSSSPSPDAAVDTRMSLDHLRGAFGGLSEMHHDILVMRELEGLSYREIGQRLGMSRPSVESTLFRARRRLSEEYEELTSGERCRSIQTLIADGGDRRLGIRDERKMARHVSYCQPCRRAAYAAGFDVAALAAQKSMREKVAALLPIPAFLKRWFGGGGHGGSGSSLTPAASQYAEPASGWAAKAAAVAATVAVAGAGAGVATTHGAATDPLPPHRAPAGAGLQPASAQKQAAGSRSAATASRSSSSSSKSTSSKRAAKRSSKATASRHARRGSSAKRAPAASGGASSSGASKGGGSTAAAGKGAGASASGSRTPSGGSTSGSASRTVNRTASTAGKAVHHTTRAVDNTANKTAAAVNKTVTTATGAANTAVTTATGAANTAVNSATSAVNNATNGAAAPVTGAVTSATGAATGAVNGAAGAAAGAVNGAASTATGAASGAVGAATGAVGGATGGLLPGG